MASGEKVWTSLSSEGKHRPDFVPALASAAQISCLEIASRSAQARTTWSIIKKVDPSSQYSRDELTGVGQPVII